MKKIAQYIYTTYVVIVFVLTFLIQLPFFLFFLMMGRRGSTPIFHLFRLWAKVFFFLILITVRVYGQEKIQKKKKYVVIANHYSFIDTPMIFATLPMMVKTLARADYGNIPVFGMIYRSMIIPVDRSNNHSKKASYDKMLNLVKNDDHGIFIFPEGSFNETSDILKPFFNGAFNLAKDGQIEILPILFPDTIKRWHYSGFFTWTPGVSRAYILDPIELDTINSMSTADLKTYAHEIMAKHLTILKNS